ncbi:MAG: LLM class flavin-dependent oxidoreductase, partial [Candidatus Eremiobacteraeota bacterium]|nr:LLM class flavin-dependent oxidoreductase [Candidatus Eremiobacteraeota bacterium]
MEFGIQFFPDVTPVQKPADAYFAESLQLCEDAEALGFTHVRTVEHYFHHYGGYSPNPIVFLAAASQRTKRARLVTGAVLPAFNNPLKLAGEIGMLDGISGGRLDVGFARAFLPHEFRRFGVSPDESVERFREGIEQVDLLLREENVTHHGRFHRIENTTSLPRPVQKPRPKFYVAALNTPESFSFAGKMGFSVMAIPLVGKKMRELLGAYRDAWRAAGHAGNGEVMLAFHLFCDRDGERARRTAKVPLDNYLRSLVDAASDWLDGLSS